MRTDHSSLTRLLRFKEPQGQQARWIEELSQYNMVIGGTVGPVSSVGRAPELQAGGRGFESCIGHTFSSLVYFNGDEVNW